MDSKTQCKELEKRRLRAGRLLLNGVPQAEVARRVGEMAPKFWTAG